MFRIKFCREIALKTLYQLDLRLEWGEPESIIKEKLAQLARLNEVERDFVLNLVKKVRQEKEEIDQLIMKHLLAWKLERLNVIDRNIMRLGIAEQQIKSNKAVIIDEMVRLAKKYGDNDTYRLVNAVLDKILQ